MRGFTMSLVKKKKSYDIYVFNHNKNMLNRRITAL